MMTSLSAYEQHGGGEAVTKGNGGRVFDDTEATISGSKGGWWSSRSSSWAAGGGRCCAGIRNIQQEGVGCTFVSGSDNQSCPLQKVCIGLTQTNARLAVTSGHCGIVIILN